MSMSAFVRGLLLLLPAVYSAPPRPPTSKTCMVCTLYKTGALQNKFYLESAGGEVLVENPYSNPGCLAMCPSPEDVCLESDSSAKSRSYCGPASDVCDPEQDPSCTDIVKLGDVYPAVTEPAVNEAAPSTTASTIVKTVGKVLSFTSTTGYNGVVPEITTPPPTTQPPPYGKKCDPNCESCYGRVMEDETVEFGCKDGGGTAVCSPDYGCIKACVPNHPGPALRCPTPAQEPPTHNVVTIELGKITPIQLNKQSSDVMPIDMFATSPQVTGLAPDLTDCVPECTSPGYTIWRLTIQDGGDETVKYTCDTIPDCEIPSCVDNKTCEMDGSATVCEGVTYSPALCNKATPPTTQSSQYGEKCDPNCENCYGRVMGDGTVEFGCKDGGGTNVCSADDGCIKTCELNHHVPVMRCPTPAKESTLPPKSTTEGNEVESTKGPDENEIEAEVVDNTNNRGSQLIVDIFMVIAVVALMI